jgi:hypothetical protein
MRIAAGAAMLILAGAPATAADEAARLRAAEARIETLFGHLDADRGARTRRQALRLETSESHYLGWPGTYRRPQIAFRIANGSRETFATVWFQASLATPGRVHPWATWRFRFDVPGMLEPHDRQRLVFDVPARSDWESGLVRQQRSAILTVTAIDAAAASGALAVGALDTPESIAADRAALNALLAERTALRAVLGFPSDRR